MTFSQTDGLANYSRNKMNSSKHRYCLCRIVGNDLPPRHGIGQTLENLKFILDNEVAFLDTTRLWVVNRIIDHEAEAEIIDLLTKRGEPFIHLPFELDAYDIAWDADRKLNHIIQLNKARNLASGKAEQLAHWTIMADGGIFFTRQGWEIMTSALDLNGVNVAKIEVYRLMKRNDEALQFALENYKVEAEQMLAYLPEANIQFDENIPYGKREKKMLLDALPNAPMYGHCLRLHDFSRFGFINELRAVQRQKAVQLLIEKVDMIFKNRS